jgi:hypothetical protein
MDKQLPAEFRGLIESAIRMARTKLEAGEELPGVAFIDAPAAPAVHVTRMVVIPMSEVPTKDAWARMIRTVSALAEARFVMVVTECWITAVNDKAAIDELMKQYGEVRFMPGRHEAVLAQIETHDGFWQGFAYTRNLGSGSAAATGTAQAPKTFDEIKLVMPKANEGRMVGLLGSRKQPKSN